MFSFWVRAYGGGLEGPQKCRIKLKIDTPSIYFGLIENFEKCKTA